MFHDRTLLKHAGRSVAYPRRGTCPATRGRAPTGAALIVALLIANRALNDLEIEQRSIAIYNTELRSSIIRSSYASFAVSDLHFPTVYGLRTNLGGFKIRGEDACHEKNGPP